MKRLSPFYEDLLLFFLRNPEGRRIWPTHCEMMHNDLLVKRRLLTKTVFRKPFNPIMHGLRFHYTLSKLGARYIQKFKLSQPTGESSYDGRDELAECGIEVGLNGY